MGFLGMRGNDDWADDQRPKNWRQAILHEYPNGDSPITALSSVGKSESTDDPEFNWWTKRLAGQAGTCAIYIDAALGTLYADGLHAATHAAEGNVVYAKVTAALASEFTTNQVVTLKDEDRSDVTINALTTNIIVNGASSSIGLMLLEADDNADAVSGSTYNLSTVDRIMITGSSFAEGAAAGRAVAYDPVKYTNYTQIHRTFLEITRTAKKTRLRTGDQVKEAKREAMEIHGIQLEKSMIWGVKREWTGKDGKPQRTSDGILNFVRNNATTAQSASAAASLADYRLHTGYTGQTWLDGGEDWFDDQLEFLFTYAPNEMIVYCGAGAISGINKLAKYTGNIQLQVGAPAFGIKVMTWETPHGTLHLKKHPLLAREVSTKYTMIFAHPKNIVMRPFDDTMYLPDRAARGVDGEMSEWLTEIGPEFHFPDQFMILDGVGRPNVV